MIAVIGHFLDRNLEYQTRLLGLPRHQGDHSGDNIAKTIEKVIRDWGIEARSALASVITPLITTLVWRRYTLV
jgi:hypothetical protein